MKLTEAWRIMHLDPHTPLTQVTRQYRLLAKELHPDKKGTTEEFIQLHQAYQTLLHQKEEEAGAAEEEEEKTPDKIGETATFPLKVSLSELFNGAHKRIAVTRTVPCRECYQEDREVCVKCLGKKVYVKFQEPCKGYMQQVKVTCEVCMGTGTQGTNVACTNCQGHMVYREKQALNLYIPPGSTHNDRITLKEKADQRPGDTVPGDLVVILHQIPDPLFQRNQSDLLQHVTISLEEALCGFRIALQVMDAENPILHLVSEPQHVYREGDMVCVAHQGLPGKPRGHLYLILHVEFPLWGTPEWQRVTGSMTTPVHTSEISQCVTCQTIDPQTIPLHLFS